MIRCGAVFGISKLRRTNLDRFFRRTCFFHSDIETNCSIAITACSELMKSINKLRRLSDIWLVYSDSCGANLDTKRWQDEIVLLYVPETIVRSRQSAATTIYALVVRAVWIGLEIRVHKPVRVAAASQPTTAAATAAISFQLAPSFGHLFAISGMR